MNQRGVVHLVGPIGTLFAFVLVSLGVLVLRHARPDLPRGWPSAS